MSSLFRSAAGATLVLAMNAALAAGEKPSKKLPFDPVKFPRLNGTITSVAGLFNTFGPPSVGDRASLVLADLLQAAEQGKKPRTVMLSFTPGKRSKSPSSYIALPGPLDVDSVSIHPRSGFHGIRLAAEDGNRKVRVDISYVPGKGRRSIEVWIVREIYGVTRGVLLIECEPLGKLPKFRGKKP